MTLADGLGDPLEPIYDEFEAALRAGLRPRIEEYLSKVDAALRPELLAELVALEVEFSAANGRAVRPDEYFNRFPEYAELLRQALNRTVQPTQIGRYRIIEKLNEGKFGEVYLALDPDEKKVALKLLKSASTSDIERMVAEYETIVELNHPGIVSAYGIDPHHIPPYIVMEYVEGEELKTELDDAKRENRVLSPLRASKLLIDIADAVGYAHSRGIWHRDLKPANILLNHEGRAVVLDFGLALREDVQRSRKGEIAGSPAYMSPEQVRGEAQFVDGRTDTWALGVILYEMLTGHPPFRGSSFAEVAEEIKRRDPRPIREINPDVDKMLERICFRCLEKRMSNRYSVAGDVVADLRHWRATDSPPEADRKAKIVPQGLRSFDQGHADFFLELLPGPRALNGLPESIGFWKARIEQEDPEETFSVGLIYGPSGCGKSSLVKAGILPRLARNIIATHIEATAQDTEVRLLKSLRRRFPDISLDLSLPEVLGMLREGHWSAQGNKTLIVLDQFEQWLDAHQGHVDQSQLTEALRHCDGERLQCIVLVRDDFWTATQRFLSALDIRVVEGKNSLLVDLFDPGHARKVLADFGRAYGQLPESQLEQHHEEFVNRAVDELTEEECVVPVRLSLFAEMFRSKSWNPTVLERLGGAAGIGVAFLQETFEASTAPRKYRSHRETAQSFLNALLPKDGRNLKGQMRSRAQLQKETKLAHPESFDELVTILSTELKLVTLTDPEGIAGDDLAGDETASYYQLTHDYLVSSLREWVTMERRKSWKGRSRILLEELTAQMKIWPGARIQPSLLQYLQLSLAVRPNQRTDDEQLLLSRTGRYQGRRLAFAGLAIAVFALLLSVYSFSARKSGILGVLGSVPSGLPERIRDLSADWHTLGILRERLEHSSDSQEKLHAAFALLRLRGISEQAALDHVLAAVPSEDANQCDNFVTFLTPLPAEVRDSILRRCHRAEEPQQKSRYATILLQMGDRRGAESILQLQNDPVFRSDFIHRTFPSWHARLKLALDVFDSGDIWGNNDSLGAFRSGVCAAIGNIPREQLSDEQSVRKLLTQLWHDPDGATHSTAYFALRKLKLWDPALLQREPPGDADWFVNSQRMTLIQIPAGEVLFDNGKRAKLPRSLFVLDREVTLEQFRTFYREFSQLNDKLPAHLIWNGPDSNVTPETDNANTPAANLSWYLAVEYCNWLSKKERRVPVYHPKGTDPDSGLPEFEPLPDADGYRLLTIEQWQYACAARSAKSFCFGDDSEELARAYAHFHRESQVFDDCASRQPNGFGLFDMHGNAPEWCWAEPRRAKSTNSKPVLLRTLPRSFYHYPRDMCKTTDVQAVPSALGETPVGFRIACLSRGEGQPLAR